MTRSIRYELQSKTGEQASVVGYQAKEVLRKNGWKVLDAVVE
jgi:hypothetical protein